MDRDELPTREDQRGPVGAGCRGESWRSLSTTRTPTTPMTITLDSSLREATRKIPDLRDFRESRRGDSNPGPLHYECLTCRALGLGPGV